MTTPTTVWPLVVMNIVLRYLSSITLEGERMASSKSRRPNRAATDDRSGPTADPSPDDDETANPYKPAQVCGSGYEVIDSAVLKTGTGVVKGRVYLLYQSNGGRNCVVTLKTTQVGTDTAMSAHLQVKGKSKAADSGSFGYYAGPIRAAAAGTCVKWGGSVGAVAYDSPFEHCG